jgi:hypothetical protein
MGTSELNKGQPILDFLAPAHAQAAAFGQPTECPFDDPTACRIAGFTGYWAFFDFRFTAPPPMFDMSDVPFMFHKLIHVIIIVAFIGAQMLFNALRVRSRDHNRDNQLVSRPLIMFIRPRHVDGQWRTALVHQEMDFAPPFAPIRRVGARLLPAQGGGAGFAVDGLPCPLDLAFLGIELNHDRHDLVEKAPLLPALEAFMQHTAAYAEPLPMNCLPLTACPQHIPDPVEHRPIVRWWSSRSPLLGRFGKQLLDLTPQRTGHTKVIDIFRFWGRVLTQDASRFRWVANTPILTICVLFSWANLFTDRF